MTVVMHDHMLVRGGAERLVLTLARGLDAPLLTGFAMPELTPWLSGVDVRTLGGTLDGTLSRYLGTAHRFAALAPEAFDPQVTVYSGVLSPFAALKQPRGRRVHYCHSPPRFIYDLREFYMSRMGVGGRIGLRLFEAWYRPRYERAIRAMDLVIANSGNVAVRLERYLGVKATVVEPPIDTRSFRWIEDGDYFLSLARLEDYKRVDLIIDAFRCMPAFRLVVASGGSREAEFRRRAVDCPNIEFTSWLDDEALAQLIGKCRAVLYLPREEDFGMSPVEAMAAGKPVIGVREGGLLETICDGETGFLMSPEPSAEDILETVHRLAPLAAAMRQACEARAGKFSTERFLDRMRSVVVA